MSSSFLTASLPFVPAKSKGVGLRGFSIDDFASLAYSVNGVSVAFSGSDRIDLSASFNRPKPFSSSFFFGASVGSISCPEGALNPLSTASFTSLVLTC